MRATLLACLTALLLTGCTKEPLPQAAEGFSAIPEANGKWLFINYWAIWCTPCREEIPELNEFATEYAEELTVYGVNYDAPPPAEHIQQAQELGISFELLSVDPAASLSYARPTVLPTTMVISPAGVIWARLLGPQTRDSLHAAMQAPAQKLAPPVH